MLTSQKLSRRDCLSRLGLYAAGLVGVTFAHGVVAPTAFADTPPPCTFNHDCGLDADNCGMGSTKYCSKYLGKNKGGKNSSCPDCVLKDGCPEKLTKGLQSWTACCQCKEDETKGHLFKYWDCCGKTTDLSADCAKCTKNSVTGCKTSLETKITGTNWCADGAKSAICTNWTDTGDCTPKKDDIDAKWKQGPA
jgi:hypothetical protein